MALTLKQQIKLAQQLVMTPQLQQAIKLLQLNRLELAQTLRQEIEQNPLLEEISLGELEPEADPSSLPSGEEQSVPEPDKDKAINLEETSPSMQEIDWEDYTNQYESTISFSRETPDSNRLSRLDFVAKKPNLQSHLQWQLTHTDLTPEEREIGNYIIGNLNPDGFLDLSTEEIARDIGCDEQLVIKAIGVIQDMDPSGVCARNVKESLLLQLERLNLTDTLPEEIIKNHLHSLEIKNYGLIAKGTGHPMKDVLAAIDIITRLNPFPGRQYSDEDTHYITPDVYVHKVGNDYLIVLNDEGLPRLKVSSVYQEILENEANVEAGTKHYLQDKLKEAMWLIKSIQQRQRTIYKVMESILKFQRGFFDNGIDKLKPLILRDVADDIEMHESTVSRVTSNKYVHTPRGIFELKFFFSTAIQQDAGEALAAKSLKERIRNLVKEEDPNKPLTDNAISSIFQKEGIKIARRTVAKYREQMGILPVKLRRQPKY
jgi:RNA polymerase sigma-54 factor